MNLPEEYFCGEKILTPGGGVWRITRRYKKTSADGPWYDATNMITGRGCKIPLDGIDQVATYKFNLSKERGRLITEIENTINQ